MREIRWRRKSRERGVGGRRQGVGGGASVLGLQRAWPRNPPFGPATPLGPATPSPLPAPLARNALAPQRPRPATPRPATPRPATPRPAAPWPAAALARVRRERRAVGSGGSRHRHKQSAIRRRKAARSGGSRALRPSARVPAPAGHAAGRQPSPAQRRVLSNVGGPCARAAAPNHVPYFPEADRRALRLGGNRRPHFRRLLGQPSGRAPGPRQRRPQQQSCPLGRAFGRRPTPRRNMLYPCPAGPGARAAAVTGATQSAIRRRRAVHPGGGPQPRSLLPPRRTAGLCARAATAARTSGVCSASPRAARPSAAAVALRWQCNAIRRAARPSGSPTVLAPGHQASTTAPTRLFSVGPARPLRTTTPIGTSPPLPLRTSSATAPLAPPMRWPPPARSGRGSARAPGADTWAPQGLRAPPRRGDKTRTPPKPSVSRRH